VRRKYSHRVSWPKYGGDVELELDRVRARLGGDLDHPNRVSEAAVVVHAGLGDDVDAHWAPMLAAASVNPVLAQPA
jgi:hypothetical protein